MRRDESWRISIVVCAAALLGAASAAAQTAASPKWEIEFHGGALFPANPTGGTVTLPAPGAVFTTATAAGGVPAPPSRRTSSWVFGDGTTLFNQAAAALTQRPGQMIALDPVLSSSLGQRGSGGSAGVRVSRALTPRLSAEVSVEYGFSSVRITPANITAVEATRASFIPAFTGIIAFNPNRVLTGVTSTADATAGDARHLTSSVALLINLTPAGTIVPYAAIGAGLVTINGELPSVRLQGNYRFLLPNGAPINETDNVSVSDARDRRAVAGIVGGGVKYHVSQRMGLRFDARVTISTLSAVTLLDAAPNVAVGLTPAGRGVLGGDPSIQFSNNSTDPVTALNVTAVAASSLTGPALTGFRTFSGSGVTAETNLTFGVYWRF